MAMQYCAMSIDKDKALAHHGIKKQRWGHRNGPPYPLNYESHSTAEKKSNPKSKIDGKTEKKKSEKRHLTDGQKKAIIIGTAAVGTALLATGGVALYKQTHKADVGKAVCERLIGASKIEMFGLNGNDIIENFISVQAKAIREKNESKYIENDCTFIWSQMAAHLNGRVDLEAGGTGKGNTIHKMMEYFSNDGKTLNEILDKSGGTKKGVYHYVNSDVLSSYDNFSDFVKRNFGEDQWGYFSCTVNTKKGQEDHAMLWTLIDGVVQLTDGVNGNAATKYFDKNLIVKSEIGDIFRADNLDMNYDKLIADGILHKIGG